MTATSLLTAEIDPNTVKPGWVALLIVLALGAATVLLWRNMGKQLKRINVDGDGADDLAPSGDPATPDSPESPAGDAAPTTSEQTPTPSEPKEHSEH
ncbi:hypothetical protein [Kribbella kalugense]|uniref:Uncharacterized protein n=1 Tax=Kribbella kalugense TaxID=2512221 RepID=A0A4R7ZF48_9ACTN|nr:hypothetical protein [Kribbella kalugense]TDW15586.1 hypothetical protein EV650_7074 [Kribbella kalugense]